MSTRAKRAGFSGDPFQILGVPRGADVREIRAAYRRLAKRHHPDINASPDAPEQMARINWAYQVAVEHARHEGPRTYRGAAQAAGQRSGRVRWYVRQRPPPAGGKLVAITRHVHLRGMRGENANVEALVVVENRGAGPLEGEARATPPWVIVSPKQFTLEPNGSQMFRVSAPNHYCADEPVEATLLFESNGGDERIKIELPCANDVLLALEPSQIDLGEVEAGTVRHVRLRLSYRGRGLPKTQVQSQTPWLEVAPISAPRRTQYFRVTVRTPETQGEHQASLVAVAGPARAEATVRLRTVAPASGA
ncbi:MAG TPA: DnaJ domain-containing protein [Chloroflexota bacterium]|jgi:hypothetical protein|nr:DnaJ domain-containing protein [Chloroflexota bacterium]